MKKLTQENRKTASAEENLSSARVGRPRAPERTRAILAATIELLAQSGYEGLSIGAVADRAKASKATIYRRWSDKRELVVAALEYHSAGPVLMWDPADNLRDDLLGMVGIQRDLMLSADSRIFTALLHAAQSDPDIAAAMENDLTEARRRDCRDVIARAVQRGELPASASAETLFELSTDRITARSIIHQKEISEDFLVDLVDNVLLPVLKHDSGA